MFHFQIIPEAEASVVTLMKSIDKVIINPLIFFLFAVAMVYFLYGVARYLLAPDDEEVRKTSKSHMIWGITGLFIMIAVFGIMRLITNTLGVNTIKIQDNGDYTVTNDLTKESTTLDDANRKGYNLDKNPLDETHKDVSTAYEFSHSVEDYAQPAPGATFTTFPFKVPYTPSALCWRGSDVVKSPIEYKAQDAIKVKMRAKMLAETGLDPSKVDQTLPKMLENQVFYDIPNKTYYVWWGAVAPIGKGTMADCALPQATVSALVGPRSKKTSVLTGQSVYMTDPTYFRVVDSGVHPTLDGARSVAINNALIEIAKQKQEPVGDVSYLILTESCFPPDPKNKNENYDYFVAVQSPRTPDITSKRVNSDDPKVLSSASDTKLRNMAVDANGDPLPSVSPLSASCVPLPQAEDFAPRSKKHSSLIGLYFSDATHYRITDSAVHPVLASARSAAINNALLQIAGQKQTTIAHLSYRVIRESYFPMDPHTGNYDYFVVVEVLK